MTSVEIVSLIHEKAKAAGVDPALMQAICTVESSLQPLALKYEPHYKWLWFPRQTASRMSMKIPGYTEDTEAALQRFSYGLPQIMGAVLREHGYQGLLQDLPHDPGTVLEYACKHMKRNMQRWPAETDWIAAWNAGNPAKTPGGMYRNQVYVDKVSGHLHRIRALV